MASKRLYTVRPLSKPGRNDQKDCLRVYLSPAALLAHQLRSGDPCSLWREDVNAGSAIAWAATEKIQDSIIQTSKTLQSCHGLKLGDKVGISKNLGHIPAAKAVNLVEVQSSTDTETHNLLEQEILAVEWLMVEPLSAAEYLIPGMRFEIPVRGSHRVFEVVSLDEGSNIARHEAATSIKLINKIGLPRTPHGLRPATAALRVDCTSIGGLSSPIAEINKILGSLMKNEGTRRQWAKRPGGILLHGPPGTGKTMLLNKISASSPEQSFTIDSSTMHKSTLSASPLLKIKKIFSDAMSQPQALILIDQLDVVASKSSENEGNNIAAILSDHFDQLSRDANSHRVLLIGATNKINEVDESLRRPGRFETEIEIPIPSETARLEILKNIVDIPSLESAPLLESIAARTHGYVGADLYALLNKAALEAEEREESNTRHVELSNGVKDLSLQDPDNETQSIEGETSYGLRQEDLEAALLQVRPTAMREVFLETPKIRWTDIGGQVKVKQILKEVIEWPLKNPTRMLRLGLEPKKGLLLYGPPGCSKTLTAQALATEAGFNFIAVKGAELLSMYVGESERAVREVFRKARAASPSIIFFDEVDAIASSRDHSKGGGVNVLTSLLNEMDGIETLKGVIILAATNKPELLDLALMRPGRLDTILYVGPPDFNGRKEILATRMGKMDVAEGANIEWLAGQMDGYSGAEIVSICQRAGEQAFRVSESLGEEVKVQEAFFLEAMTEVHRQITPAMRRRYEQWKVGDSFDEDLGQ